MKTKIDCGCEKDVFVCRIHANSQDIPTPVKLVHDIFKGEDRITNLTGDKVVCIPMGYYGPPIVRAVNAHEELLNIVKEIYSNENDVTRRKHSDEMRFRMEEAIAKAEGK